MNMRVTPIGANKVQSSSLWKPRGVRKPRKFSRDEQVLIDHDVPKGHRKVKVMGIHSVDGGKTHIGTIGLLQVERVSLVSGMNDKQGRTVGLWKKVS